MTSSEAGSKKKEYDNENEQRIKKEYSIKLSATEEVVELTPDFIELKQDIIKVFRLRDSLASQVRFLKTDFIVDQIDNANGESCFAVVSVFGSILAHIYPSKIERLYTPERIAAFKKGKRYWQSKELNKVRRRQYKAIGKKETRVFITQTALANLIKFKDEHNLKKQKMAIENALEKMYSEAA
ncbi:MAG: hypothetical protein ACJA0H_000104 [Francisellaceae bacterium]|jgi:hypothetical protein